MQIYNQGKTYSLSPPVFASLHEALAIRGKVNADAFCGYEPKMIYMSRVDVEHTDRGWEIVRIAIQTPVTAPFPAVEFSTVLNPKEA